VSVVVLAAAAAEEGEACVPADIKCWLGSGIGEAISTAANEGLQEFVNQILEAFGKAVASLGTMWVAVPSPVTVTSPGGGVSGNATPPLSQSFEQILSYVTWVSAGIAIMSLIAAGVMMASRRRHGDGEAHMGRVGVILFSVILLSAASALVAGFLPQAMSGNRASSVVGFMQNQLYWYTAGLAVLSVILAATRMAITQRAQPVKELLQSLLTLIAVSGAGLVGIVLATQAADAFSVWILNNSMDCDVGGADAQCFGRNIFFIMQLTAESGIGLFALFILGILAYLMTVVQVILMIVRGAMLVVLAGILPLTASFTNTEMGRMWFKRALGWTIAFVLYKPAAAIVYATAFRLVGSDAFKSNGQGLVQVLSGMALMLIALIALPALMKFVAPAVSAMSGGGSGAGLALAAAGGAAIGDIASGAIRSGGKSGGGNGGGNGGSQPSAPSGATPAPTGGKAAASAPSSGSSAATGSAAASSGSAATAAGSSAAAAAGPVGVAVAGAAKAAGTAAQAAGAAKQAASGAVSGEESS
jgi:hypothetical protein